MAKMEDIRETYKALDDDELGNELYTLRNERHFLNCYSDDDVALRIALLETEVTRRSLTGSATTREP